MFVIASLDLPSESLGQLSATAEGATLGVLGGLLVLLVGAQVIPFFGDKRHNLNFPNA